MGLDKGCDFGNWRLQPSRLASLRPWSPSRSIHAKFNVSLQSAFQITTTPCAVLKNGLTKPLRSAARSTGSCSNSHGMKRSSLTVSSIAATLTLNCLMLPPTYKSGLQRCRCWHGNLAMPHSPDCRRYWLRKPDACHADEEVGRRNDSALHAGRCYT